MNLSQAKARISLDASAQDSFILIAPIDLTSIFTGYGPLPAVIGTEDQVGKWDCAGQSRTVLLSDGTTAREILETYDCPNQFSYTVDVFTGPLRFLVRSAHGSWQFSEENDQTDVIWTYSFSARSVLVLPIVWFIAQVLWRGYMRKAIRLAAVQLNDSPSISKA